MSKRIREVSRRLKKAIRSSDDLRRPKYRGHSNPYRGHCYVASEAAYHLLGGKEAGWKPRTIRVGGDVHWFLASEEGEILDLTAEQFGGKIEYEKGRGRGFLTRRPSRRAAALIRRSGFMLGRKYT